MNSIEASAHATPNRDRLAFPALLQPSPSDSSRAKNVSTTASSSGNSLASSSASSATANNQPATIEGLLAANASASSPQLAALEQAIGERNVLSAQNSQLWKLIEKQRTGYNQILKELERVRAERDGFKSKLQATFGRSRDMTRKAKEGDKEKPAAKRSDSQSSNNLPNRTDSLSSVTYESTSDPRKSMARHYSDDQPTPRTQQHQIHSSKSQEPISLRDRQETYQTNHSSPTLAPVRSKPPSLTSSSSSLSEAGASMSSPAARTPKNNPPPRLIVPPRSEGLPVPASEISATGASVAPYNRSNNWDDLSTPSQPHSQPQPQPNPQHHPNHSSTHPHSQPSQHSNFQTQSPLHHQMHAIMQQNGNGSSMATPTPAPTPSSAFASGSPFTRPLQVTRKSSIPSNGYGDGNTNASGSGSGSGAGFNSLGAGNGGAGSPFSVKPNSNHVAQQMTAPMTPETILPESGRSGGATTSSSSSSFSSSQPHQTHSHPSYAGSSLSSSGASLGLGLGTGLAASSVLRPVPEDFASRRLLSRESRISLPDEAKQYIASMGESPSHSPHQSHAAGAAHQTSDMSSESGHVNQTLASTMTSTSASEVALAYSQSRSYGQGPSGRSYGVQHPNGHGAQHAAREHADVPKRVEESNRNSQFLDMDDEEGTPVGEDEEEEERQRMFSQQQEQQQQQRGQGSPPRGKGSKLRAAVEDFPLPPSGAPPATTVHPAQALAQAAQAQDQAQAQESRQGPNGTPPIGTSQYPTFQSIIAEPLNSPFLNQETPQNLSGSFRALPLLSTDLPHTQIQVSHSSVRPNDRGKDVLSFIVVVEPGNGKEGWRVEKLYSDVLGLDQRIRASVGKGVGKKIASLPEGKLWKDHAPAKVDQRKVALENYLQTLINLPVKNKDEVIAFFTSDIVRETKQPVVQVGYKEGYLTKRGKNFGGWKTRYFVLEGPVLEYYESRGGTHLGSIVITGAQIGRQQRTADKALTDDEKEYRHAFLIVEAKKGPGGNHPRHVLCAESDADRDSWVEMLVRYVLGTYSEEPVVTFPTDSMPLNAAVGASAVNQPRSSTSSSNSPYENANPAPGGRRHNGRGMSKDDVIKGAAVPISQLAPDASNAKLFQSAPLVEDFRAPSPTNSTHPQGLNEFSDAQTARRILERGNTPSSLPDTSSSPLSSSLPNSASPLEAASGSLVGVGPRSNSELGHYPELSDRRPGRRQNSPEKHRGRDNSSKSFQPTLNPVMSSPPHDAPQRPASPEKADTKVKISGPLNGAPIPSGFKFGKDAPPDAAAAATNERREKAKSRSFWGFGKTNGADKSHTQVSYAPRAVFAVPLEDSLEVAEICNLPAIVFRSIQYLEAKKADQEEGIYRLNGSSAVIKSLRDRFNMEGDLDLLGSDEYWDPHAIAGLLKSFLRELPASILTRDLHLKFLAVIDFVDPQERIKELSQLIAALPIANYSLLRALTAHLILIVQNSSINKMTMRNIGIVFSPTLGIPAGVFSLMLGEFNRVFNVDAENDGEESTKDDMQRAAEGSSDQPSGMNRRNSRQYSEAAADQLLGFSGRTLAAPAEEGQSDADDFSSVQDESGTETTENEATLESSAGSSPGGEPQYQLDQPMFKVVSPDIPSTPRSKASNVATSKGLNITVSSRGNRHSRMMGLPASPRPMQSPTQGPGDSLPSPCLDIPGGSLAARVVK